MKKLNIYLLFLFASIPFVSLNAQDRNVVWVHGLDGDSSKWKHYEEIFSNIRQINGHRKTYNTEKGIDYAANHVIRTVDADLGSGATNPRNIAIGHSMGGVTIRDVDRLTGSNKRFGGLIMVTSPNYGAPIANSILNGSVESAATDACNKIGAGPLAELYWLPWDITAFISTDVLCNLIFTNDVIQNLRGNPLTNSDLKVGSQTINDINAYNTTIPRICISVQENSPVHWRLFSSEYTEGDGDNDTKILSDVNTARDTYNAYYNYNIAKGIANTWDPWMSTVYFSRAAQWKRGRDWIDGSETIWNALIKTTRNETYTYSYWEYKCIYVDPNAKDIPYPGDDECEWQWVYYTKTQTVAVNYPSDGFFPDYTQKLKGLPSGNYYTVNGANHVEVRNMSNSSLGDNTFNEFEKIWKRRPGDFFQTSLRNP